MSEIAEKQDIATSGGPAMTTTNDSSAALINMIEHASRNPDVDVEKLERLWNMYDSERKRSAEQAFNTALSQMQANMPVIREGGEIVHSGKTISTFGRWDEDVLPVIKPILKEHGFGLSFRVDTSENVRVEAVLSHEAGHSERTTITLPADASGSKNAVQAVASSVSYGKRYTASSLLNLEIHGQDDDGSGAGEPKVTDEQLSTLRDLVSAWEPNAEQESAMLKHLKVNDLSELRADRYDYAYEKLKSKVDNKK